MSTLTLHQIPPSPNSRKVRLALGLLQIPCRLVSVDPSDRASVVKLSGQPLTPVLEHEGRAIFDSHAIVRYLDGNWAEGSRLFDADRDRMQEIERWELFARTELMGKVLRAVFRDKSKEALEAANGFLSEAVSKIEEALEDQEYLMGAAANAADLSVAPFVAYGMLDPAEQEDGSMRALLAQHLRVPAKFTSTQAWVERVLSLEDRLVTA